MEKDIVSIMLVTYNRLELTKRMFDNFTKTTNSPFRLIIIDNGSTDGTVEWIKQLNHVNEYCQGLHKYFNEKNMGIAIGRNQALLIANKFKDNYLCTIDNDVELHVGWLKECLNVIKHNPKFMVGINFEGKNYEIKSINGCQVQWKREGNLGTALTVFHRKLHEAIGFFIMEFGLYGEEDSDYGYRARMAGWNIGYLPTNGVHFGEGDLDVGEYREFKTEQHKKNLKAFQKNCWDYLGRMKSIYISFEDKNISDSNNL